MEKINYDKLRSMIARCEWTFAKTMPFAPHEYFVKEKCPLTTDEFEYFVNMQREYGVKERWGKYNNPYLYIDDYKYWTMGAPLEDTTVINRAKASAVNDVHQLYEGINKGDTTMSYVDEYIIRNNYACEVMQEWSQRLSADFPELKKCEDIRNTNVMYTGLVFPYKNIPDAITTRIQMDNRSLYYGLTYMPETKLIRSELQEALSFVNNDNIFIKGSDWLYYRYVSFENGYESLKTLIEEW